MNFLKDHFDELLLLFALLVFVTLYAFRPGDDTRGWIDTLQGALILALTGGGVKALINFKNGGKPPEEK